MKHRAVRVAVTTLDGEVLDIFIVQDYRDDHPFYACEDDAEFVHSPISRQELGRRIEKYVEEVS